MRSVFSSRKDAVNDAMPGQHASGTASTLQQVHCLADGGHGRGDIETRKSDSETELSEEQSEGGFVSEMRFPISLQASTRCVSALLDQVGFL